MSSWADSVTSGGNPAPAFSDANSGGGGPLDLAFIACIQRPDWRPMAHLPRGLHYDQMEGPELHKPRKRRFAGTYTATCPECGIPFTAERSLGGKRKYHEECAEVVRLRKQCECYARAAERGKA